LKTSNQEVRARGDELFVVADADSYLMNSEGVHAIRLPEHYGVLSPILHVLPLQLLAFHTVTARGRMWTSRGIRRNRLRWSDSYRRMVLPSQN
jgi:glucosamine 6-phosphate synthetase-like amidotransferase/phosphosugar isomerase protein